MHQVQSNPLEEAYRLGIELNDSRWPSSEGWAKMERIVNNFDGTKTIIHYVYNESMQAFNDFKFKY